MTTGVTPHRLVVEAIADHHLGAVRPRTDQRHAAKQDVQQLRQLVDAEAPQEAADRSDPRIVPGRRLPGPKVGHVGEHGPELEDINRLVVEPDARLDEQDRSGAGQPNQQGGQEQNR